MREEVQSRELEVLERVRAIPEGFVATYGDVSPGSPRFAGAVLFKCDEPPIHRIINEGSRYLVPRDDGYVLAGSTEEERQHVAEVIFRFVQGSIYRNGVFNGDPHPGNYRFHADGTVTFLDFGLVKRWAEGEFEQLMPLIDPLLDREADVMVDRMVKVGFLPADHGLDAKHVWDYVSAPYKPYLEPEFTFTRDFTGTTMMSLLDVTGPFADVIAKLMMPTSFVILDRVVWGMCALLGQLGARNRWRDLFEEYRFEIPPTTELGRAERAWYDALPQNSVGR